MTLFARRNAVALRPGPAIGALHFASRSVKHFLGGDLMKSTRFLSATFAAVAMLSACGGGGSDAPAPAPATALTITADNQAVVARAAMDGSTALGGAQALANDDPP